ncbi:MAG: DUF7847 domain-containing protein [Methanoculleaceae archaeon]
MVLATLEYGVSKLRQTPVLWVPGLIIGLMGGGEIMLQCVTEIYYATDLALLELIVLPFLTGGFFGAFQSEEESSLRSFFRNGVRWYFPLLLPMLVIISVAILTMILVTVPLSITGTVTLTQDLIGIVVFGVGIPVIAFCYFYDTAVVFEKQNVFASILRSIEFVTTNGLRTLILYMVNILIILGAGAVALLCWSVALAGKLMPLVELTPEDLQAITPTDIMQMIGIEGVAITAVLYAAFLAVTWTILNAYKASFFLRYAGESAQTGTYDEKGRWYRY